jgi:hypothetical protein
MDLDPLMGDQNSKWTPQAGVLEMAEPVMTVL